MRTALLHVTANRTSVKQTASRDFSSRTTTHADAAFCRSPVRRRRSYRYFISYFREEGGAHARLMKTVLEAHLGRGSVQAVRAAPPCGTRL